MNLAFFDNGTTGTMGFYSNNQYYFSLVPVFKCLNYQKEKHNITRVDTVKLKELLLKYNPEIVYLERPMTRIGRNYNSMFSGMRALEAELITFESLNIPYKFIDSKEWQKYMLPGIKTTSELKEMSMSKGLDLAREYNLTEEEIKLIQKHKDADGLLGCVYIHSLHN